jgi:hypothetical protein
MSFNMTLYRNANQGNRLNGAYPNGDEPGTGVSAPTGFSASYASDTSLDLSWTDNADNETGYEIDRSPNGTDSWSNITTTAANATSYTDTGLTVDTTYYYRIRGLGTVNSSYATANGTTTAPSGVVLSMSIAGAGRLGFYYDYSELSAAGTHTFYVARTHGTTGAVSVSYATSGDTHTTVSGTLSWADGEADIKTFTAEVTSGNLSTHSSAGLGEHRIVATLSSPTGGASLHRNSVSGNWTRAYGVVDNSSMIASDSNAYFIDFDAVSNGTGTQASPYNDWYSLKTAQNGARKRYLYMKGTFTHNNDTIDLDNSAEAMGGTSEATRVYFMAWPGNTITIQDDGTGNQNGFYSDTSGSSDYLTFKNITLDGLDNSTFGGPGFAFRARTDNKSWTIEHCTITNEVQGQNSGQAAIYLEIQPVGFNIYNCSITNITRADGNPGVGVESYDGGTHSISSCTFESSTGIFQKDGPASGEFGMTVRHCIFGTEANALFDNLGTNPQGQYHIFQGNLCYYVTKNVYTNIALQFGGPPGSEGSGGGPGVWMCNNVIYNSGANDGDSPAVLIDFHQSGICSWNNIWVDGFGHLRVKDGTSAVDFCDYDHSHNVATAGTSMWEFDPSAYTSTSSMQAGTGFEGNLTTGDPLFTSASTYDVSLGIGSPCIDSGVSGTDQGVYLIGTEQLGAS